MHCARDTCDLLHRQPEADQDDRQADQLGDARNDAERQIADDDREAGHQRGKCRRASGAKQRDRAGEQKDRQHAGDDSLRRDLQQIFTQPMRQMPS